MRLRLRDRIHLPVQAKVSRRGQASSNETAASNDQCPLTLSLPALGSSVQPHLHHDFIVQRGPGLRVSPSATHLTAVCLLRYSFSPSALSVLRFLPRITTVYQGGQLGATGIYPDDWDPAHVEESPIPACIAATLSIPIRAQPPRPSLAYVFV